jgi:hypothetical protein
MNRRAQIIIPAYLYDTFPYIMPTQSSLTNFMHTWGPPPTPLWVEGTKMAASFNKRFDFYTIFSFYFCF